MTDTSTDSTCDIVAPIPGPGAASDCGTDGAPRHVRASAARGTRSSLDLPLPPDRWERASLASGNVFSTPEFVDSWRAHFAAGRETLILDLPGFDDPPAIASLTMARIGPLKVARFAGHTIGDDLSPACAPSDRERVARAILDVIDDHRVDVLLAERLPAGDGWHRHFAGRVVHSEPSPVLPIGGLDWETYLAGRSANFRQQVRRRTRNLVRSGATFRLADSATLDADLDALFRLHRDRWGAETTFTRSEAVHRAFAEKAAQRGWVRLWLLEIDGEPLAAVYGFRFARSEGYYQSGRSPRWDRESVGLVLLAHAIRNAIEDGVEEYRLLRGGEAYKYRFTDDKGTVESVAVGRSPLGRAALASASAIPRRMLVRRLQ